VAYRGFDIAMLGVCFDAFGRVVPVALLVMGYFLGTLGSWSERVKYPHGVWCGGFSRGRAQEGEAQRDARGLG
jgi:hypothetical protein